MDSIESVGKIYLGFTIAVNGSVTDVELIHPKTVRLTDECRQKFLDMPNWTPGQKNGEPAEMRMTLPVYVSWW